MNKRHAIASFIPRLKQSDCLEEEDIKDVLTPKKRPIKLFDDMLHIGILSQASGGVREPIPSMQT